MNKNHRGFSVVELVLVLVAAGLIAGIGWYVVKQKDKTNSVADSASSQTNQISQPSTTSDWEEYKIESTGISYKYPTMWVNNPGEPQRSEAGEFENVAGFLLSPTGKQLKWSFSVIGGGGGGCEPGEDDVPFAAGNNCPTLQTLSIRQAQSLKAKTVKIGDQLFEDAMYIVHTKYGSPEGSISYQICFQPHYNVDREYITSFVPEVGTVMGFVLPCGVKHTGYGFGASYPIDNEADFDSAVAKTAEEIMASFQTY